MKKKNKENKTKDTRKIKSFFIYATFIFIIGFFTFTFEKLNFFEKLDFRVYDAMLHLKKDPPMSDKILQLNIDDISIREFGDWPWSRDILADTLIRMKEFDVDFAVFDIEYISPSLLAVATNAEENISNKIYETELLTTDLIKSIPQSASSGYDVEDLQGLADELISDYLYPQYTDLYDYVSNHITRDNDEYFGKSLQFLGNSWLTVNTRDLQYEYTPEEIEYIRNRLLTSKVDDIDNFIFRDNEYTVVETYVNEPKGFTPALHTLIKRSNGVGFTNSNVDSDGIRRRMELFYEYDGKYLPQLVFGPLMDAFDTTKFTREKYSLIIHNAKVPGHEERVDIKIPLDKHGRMLINWQHEETAESKDDLSTYYGINYDSVISLRNLDILEKNIVQNLTTVYNSNSSDLDNCFIFFDENGYPLPYFNEVENLVLQYQELSAYKDYLLNKCTGYDLDNNVIDGIEEAEYKEYFDARRNFFDRVLSFITKNPYEEIVTTQVNLSETHKQNIKEIFDIIGGDVKAYQEQFANLYKKFNQKYCLIGMTAASTTDVGATPFAKQYTNVCLHANLMNTILTQNFITPVPYEVGLIFSILISILLALFFNKSDTFQNILNGIIRVLLLVSFVCLFVFKNYYIPLISGVLVFTLLDFICGTVYRFISSSREKKFIKQAFSTYLSKDVVNQLVDNPDSLKLGGEEKHITALFTDIKSFSSFSELVTPEELVAILNKYLSKLSDQILETGGTIDKYIGDAIVSFFGAPIYYEDHAYRACAAAIQMKKIEKEFNKLHMKDKSIPQELKTRIGINTGNMVVGNMGTENKMNYTIMGNDVNLASRLEGVNKAYGSWIICSEQTWNEANSGSHKDEIVVRRLDKVRVVGINKPVQLYNIIGFRDEVSREQLASIDIFHAALDKYLAKDFVNAGKLFIQAANEYNNDETALIFAERCKTYIQKGVSEKWDGVLNMTSK